MGKPNAGKSSLFNALVGTERAIVSDTAGTTRDIVAAELHHHGVTIKLLDTAGLESILDSSPRAAAQHLLHQRLQTCDAVLYCIDLNSTDVGHFAKELESSNLKSLPKIVVGTKLDLAPQSELGLLDVAVSVVDTASLNRLIDRLFDFASSQLHGKFTQATHHTAVRCVEALQRSTESLKHARSLVESCGGDELIASELHCVLDDLSAIIGEVHNDDILGEIFSRFCIGK